MSVNPGADTQTTRIAVPLTSEYPIARVDLLPPEVIADRRFRRARGWMAMSVVGTALLVGGVYALAVNDANNAADELALEQARTTVLNAEAAQYAAVPAILASVDRAESALDIAMATDIEWYRYLSQMSTVTPEGVWFTSVNMTAVAPDTVSADPLAPADSVADISTVGRALTYEDVATWMDSLESVTGYDHVLLANGALDPESASEPFVDFQVTVKALADAYSDRYVPEAE